MNKTLSLLDACLVLHRADAVERVLGIAKALAGGAGMQLRVLALLTRSGDVIPANVIAICAQREIQVLDCFYFDDIYLDFSAYALAAQAFSEIGSPGALFINDTIATKHNSVFLRRKMIGILSMVASRRFGFPVMVGPFRHSEFSLGVPTVEEFASTFLFHLNLPAFELLMNTVNQLPSLELSMFNKMPNEMVMETSLLQFCHLHALQLESRYSGPDAHQKLVRKLCTVYAERHLSFLVKQKGVLWYVAGGIAGRILVPLELMFNRIWLRIFSW